MTMAEQLARIAVSKQYFPIVKGYWLAMLKNNRQGLREYKLWKN